MATSKFRINYDGGGPDVQNSDLTYTNAQGELAGGTSTLEEVSDPNQQQVLMLVESSTEILTAMKDQGPRYTWVEDVDGWA